MSLRIVQDEICDEVLSTDPFALLCGMVLYNKFPVELAFTGPAKILHRFGTLDPAKIAAADPVDFAAVCASPPPVHRQPVEMAATVQRLARHVDDRYGPEAAAIWSTAATADLLYSRLTLLPGFTPRRSRIFVALLGKQAGVRPHGWEQVAGEYAAPEGVRSVADVHDPYSLEELNSVQLKNRARRRKRRRPAQRRQGGPAERSGRGTRSVLA